MPTGGIDNLENLGPASLQRMTEIFQYGQQRLQSAESDLYIDRGLMTVWNFFGLVFEQSQDASLHV